ncbi:hypothetical protein LA080_012820 [Diaporthe eres]|nr:hypothetical protein LA080_012820 [Diaporthe eres]
MILPLSHTFLHCAQSHRSASAAPRGGRRAHSPPRAYHAHELTARQEDEDHGRPGPPRVTLPPKERVNDNTAARSLTPQLDELVRRTTLKKDILESLAITLDNFVAS